MTLVSAEKSPLAPLLRRGEAKRRAGDQNFAPVRVRKAAEVIAETLRSRVARGELRAGDGLPGEAELMQRFGVSRPTLREALRILEAQSLITVARGARGGARVQLPDGRLAAQHVALLLQVQGATLADVYEARMLIEPGAARLAAERAPKHAAAALRRLIKEEERAFEDPDGFSRAAIGFQERLVEVSGNRTLALLIGLLHELVEMQRRAGVARNVRYPERVTIRRRVIAAHRALVDLIAAGEGAQAAEHWRRFLSGVAEIVLGHNAARRLVTLAE